MSIVPLILLLVFAGCSNGNDATEHQRTITGIYFCVADSDSVVPRFFLQVLSENDTLSVHYGIPSGTTHLSSPQNETWYHPDRVYGFSGSNNGIFVMTEFWRESDGMIGGWTIYSETGITPPSQAMFKGRRVDWCPYNDLSFQNERA